MTRTPILGLALAALALPAFAQDEPAPAAEAATDAAQADAAESQGGTGALVNAEGAQLGNVSVSLTASGVTLVTMQAEGITEGVHGLHLHTVGACEGPTFESAGDHLADGRDHGIMSADGPHPGDLPNATAASDGTVTYEAFAAGLTAEMLFDEDGTALLVHAGPDDYTSQPSGNSGDRIACAVIEPGGDLAPDAIDVQDDGAAEEGEAPTEEAPAEEGAEDASGG